jgi:hypothetical protein
MRAITAVASMGKKGKENRGTPFPRVFPGRMMRMPELARGAAGARAAGVERRTVTLA